MSSNKFTRLHGVHRTETDPNAVAATSRIYGDQVAVGQPMPIQGMIDPEQEAAFRRDVQESLEFLAKKRLLEAEKEAQAFLEKSRQLAREEGEKLVNELLEKARAEVATMIAQAQSEVDGIRDAANEAGFKVGFEEGYTTALQQVDNETVELLKSANFIVENAYQAERRVLKDFESHTLAIIQRIAEKILHDDLGDVSEKVLNLIQRAVESLYLSGKVKVVLNPQVLHELRQFSANTQQAVDALSRFEFIADPALDTYQYFIIGQEGSFDISPKSQAAQLLEPIEKNLKLPRSTANQSLSIEPTSDFREESDIEPIHHSSTISEDPANGLPPKPAELEASPAIANETENALLEMPNALPITQVDQVAAPHPENPIDDRISDEAQTAVESSIAADKHDTDVSAVLAKLDALTLDAETDRQSLDETEGALGAPPWLQADEAQTPDKLSAFEAPVVTDNPRVFGRPKEPDGTNDTIRGNNEATAFQEVDFTSEEQP